ncbi:putative symplekin [Cocos nucifera]|uniref:Putative symplekin n=1 Tax=Cocos nucifera TaxID=13894 RepID=A0A8K0I7I0_COCNU|nr:putative symplekin [Cocos nucifera]
MVGMMAANWGETAVSLLNSVRSSGAIPAKLRWLRQLKEILLHRDLSLLPDFVPRLAELQVDHASPVRKLLAEMIGDIGMKHMELLPEMIPSLICFLKDETPAVARQAIITGTYLFRNVLEKVGLCSSDLDDSLKSSWAWMLAYKDAVFPIAVQRCNCMLPSHWRARLVEALKAINAGELAEPAVNLNENSGGLIVSREEISPPKDDKLQECDERSNDLGCKRNMDEECSDLSQDDVVSSKRARQTSGTAKEITSESLQTGPDPVQINFPLISSTASRNGSSGPVQQLVNMFGALVAQGDKAAGSLEILVSSITCDLLAEVVIANMQHLPPTCPEADGKEELVPGLGHASGFVSNCLPALQPSALVSNILSLSSSLPMLASLLNIQPSASHDISKIQQEDEEKMTSTTDATLLPSSVGDGIAATSASLTASVEPSELVTETDSSAVPLYVNMETMESKIPGLDSTSSFEEIQESQDASHTSTAELQETNLGHAINLDSTMRLDASSTDCVATSASEAQSPKIAITDASQLPCISSVAAAPQYVLPKMTVTNVDLTDEDKDHLQKEAFMRILEAYKQIAISGGSQIHFSLLSHLGIEWRARLVEALKAINAGELAEPAVNLNENSGGLIVSREEISPPKDDKLQECDERSNDLGCKRNMDEECSDLSQDDVVSSKRARQTSGTAKEITSESLQTGPDPVQINFPLISSTASRNGSSGPVQQLVNMFGALVAQGDKAAGSLEILVSSITCDLLAEVVIANMQHLPPTCPEADGKEELVPGLGHASGFVSNCLPALQPSALVSNILSLSSSLPMLASLLNIQPSASHDISKIQQEDEEKMTSTTDATLLPSSVGDGIAATSASLTASVEPSELVTETDSSAVPLYVNMETMESKIPGLDSTSSFEEIQESQDASHTSTAELQETNLGHAINLDSTMRLDASSTDCVATSASEAQSPKIAITDASQLPCISSVAAAPQYVLPKMTVTNVDLTDEDKDHLQKEAFMRILEAYKQIAISGGSQIHFSLLSHLGIEYPLELDTWELLQKHVLSDYMNHEGHELTLRVLYRLYREAEQDQDFFSSRTATSVYETFLLTVAEILRDTFPASDKSLSRLLGEVPYLPEGVLKLLERLCSPENERHEKDFQSGDRVTQGLSAVWNLILLRPSNRDRCLQIALQVANKLFPMPSISQKIEVFADEKLQSVADDIPAVEDIDADGSALGLQKNGDLEKPPAGQQPPPSLPRNELTSDNPSDQNTTSSSISEAQRCMSLYFALCTKKHSLLRRIFAIYKSIPKAAKQAVHRHIPILVRTIGSSPELLGIISDPPTGSESLLMQILPIFPRIVNLPPDKFQAGLTRILQGSPQTGPCLSPPEVLIAIHGIDPEKDGIPLKKVMDACSACFEQQNVFTQQVLAKVEQIPLPLLFMRTVIQAIGVFPALIWKYPKLWVGFLKCAIQTKPQSFSVLLQLENALIRNPMLRAPLAEHANQPNIRSTLPRSTLVVLGLVQDSQASGPAQTSQSQAAETGSSAADVATEVTQESTAIS